MRDVDREGSSHILNRADDAVLRALDRASSLDPLKTDTALDSTLLASRFSVDEPIRASATTVRGGNGDKPWFGIHCRTEEEFRGFENEPVEYI